jgi:hypothetical protein
MAVSSSDGLDHALDRPSDAKSILRPYSRTDPEDVILCATGSPQLDDGPNNLLPSRNGLDLVSIWANAAGTV